MTNGTPGPDRMTTRKDILLDRESARVQAIESQLLKLEELDKAGDQVSDKDPRVRIRKSLLESDASDPNGFERVLGRSDLVSVNFLSRGLQAARAVCQIRVPSPGNGWYGSGFLAGPGLLITNNHVLGSPKEAAQAEAEFGYEHDVEGVLQEPVQFNLAPHAIFFTDIAHDITLVAVADYSEGGVPLDRYGYLPLLPLSGKGLHGEWVTIPQHPGGQPKQMAVRANRIAELWSENLQTTIKAVEDETALNFGALRTHDAINALEATRHARMLLTPQDIII